MKVGVIVLSRFDSSRLPGKALRLVNDKPLIQYVMERAMRVDGAADVVLATSSREVDDVIARYGTQNNIDVFRGSTDDVAHRFLKCMEHNGWDAAIRVNGDSPLHSHMLLTEAIKTFYSAGADLITNIFRRSYPIGMAVEVVSRQALESAYGKMIKATNHEHVTEYFYENHEDFNIVEFPRNRLNHSKVRLAVDTQNDLDRFNWIISKLGRDYLKADYEKIIDLYAAYEDR